MMIKMRRKGNYAPLLLYCLYLFAYLFHNYIISSNRIVTTVQPPGEHLRVQALMDLRNKAKYIRDISSHVTLLSEEKKKAHHLIN